MIIIHTQNGVIETEGKRFVFDDKFVKVYRDDGNLIGAYMWGNIIGVTATKETEHD